MLVERISAGDVEVRDRMVRQQVRQKLQLRRWTLRQSVMARLQNRKEIIDGVPIRSGRIFSFTEVGNTRVERID